MNRPIRRLVTSLASVLLLISAARAATPVAIWDGSFPEANVADQGFTLTYNGNTRGENGAYITIADANGLGVTFAKSGMAATTVAVRYSSYTGSATTNETIGTFSASSVNNRVGIHRYTDGSVYGSHSAGNLTNGKESTSSGTFNGSSEVNVFFLRYSGNGVSLFDKSGSELYRKSGYKWAGDFSGLAVTAFTIGGACGTTFSNLSAASGLKILGVAVFNSELASSDMAAYRFPSDISEYNASSVSGAVNWSSLAFDNPWSSSDAAIANITLSGDAVITLDTDIVANAINLLGSGNVTIEKAESASVTLAVLDFSALTGTSTIGSEMGSAKIVAGTDTTLNRANDNGLEIAAGKRVTVKGGALTASKVTNAGTLHFVGGTAETPIALTGDGNFGKVTLAADTYVKNTVTDNRNHLVTGADLTSFYAIGKASGEPGMGQDNALTNLTLVIDTQSGGRTWLERVTIGAEANVALKVNTTAYMNVSPVVQSLSGSGSITRAGSNTLTIGCAADADYAGTSDVPFTLTAGTATQTLSGNYTGALTVDDGAHLRLSDNATPSAIVANGSVTLAYADEKTLSGVITGTGDVNVTGTGAVKLVNMDGFTGTLAVAGGTVTVDAWSQASSVTVASGTTLKVNVSDAQWASGYTLLDKFAVAADVTVVFVNNGQEVTGDGRTLPAQGVSWTGAAGDNAWGTAANWSAGLVPTATDNVILARADASITVTAEDVAPAAIIVRADTTLTGTLTDFGAVTIENNATLTLDGTGTIAGVTGGTFVKEGEGTLTVNANTAGWAFNGVSVTVTEGTLDTQQGSYKDLALTVASGATVTHNGWATGCSGTLTLNCAEDATVFGNSGGSNNIAVSGFTSVVKNGAGTLTCKAAFRGATVTVAEGVLKLEAAVVEMENLSFAGAGSVELTAGTKVFADWFSADYTGALPSTGVIVFDGALPTSVQSAHFVNSEAWTGTVWIKNVTGIRGFDIGAYANGASKVKLTGVSGYLRQGPNSGNYEPDVLEVVLEDSGDTAALSLSDGYSDQYTKISRLTGTGTLKHTATGSQQPIVWVVDMSGFTGTLKNESTSGGYRFWVSDEAPSYGYRALAGSLQIDAGKVVTVPSGKTWTFANNGFILRQGGELKLADATAKISGKLSGAGALSATGFLPHADVKTILTNEVANTGTFHLKDHTWNSFDFGSLGNVNSKLALSGVRGYAPQVTNGYCAAEVVLVDTQSAIALTLSDGYSYLADKRTQTHYTFRKVSGSGTIKDTKNNPTPNYRFEDLTAFTGVLYTQNMRFTIGSVTTPYADAGKILVQADATAQMAQAWYAKNGIVVAGTLAVTNEIALTSALTLNDGATLAFAAGAKLTPTTLTTTAETTVKVTIPAGLSLAEKTYPLLVTTTKPNAGFVLTNATDYPHYHLKVTSAGVSLARNTGLAIIFR